MEALKENIYNKTPKKNYIYGVYGVKSTNISKLTQK